VAETSSATPKPTLGLTGLTSNAMALIAPGAFLWLTYAMQSGYGQPAAGMSMWFGILLALFLCLATAVAYAELSKLYPGAGSSYFFAEQAFLSKKQAFKWARLAKFMVGWASHLYYWVYPGVMVGVTALVAGYMVGQLDAHFWGGTHLSPGVPSPLFMIVFCVVFAFGVSYIAFRGVGGTTGVNAAINVIQITALIIFSCMAITHRLHVKEGDPAWTMDSTGTPVQYVQDSIPDSSKTIPDPKDPTKLIQDPAATVPKLDPSGASVPVYVAADAKGTIINGPDGNPIVIPTDKDGKPPAVLPPGAAKAVPQPFTITYKGGILTDDKGVTTAQYHESAKSVVAPHKFNFVFIQACVAILILVGFESVTAMGEEAKNAKRDIPKAVILSLVIQGGFCYLFEYFAANYFISSAYQMQANAAVSSAPIGDMMQLVGAWVFGTANAGWWFMMIQAVTVFLALIGTTLSCMSTGARVTYAMGRDEEVPNHFGLLHGKNLTPHRAIWTLAAISSVIGIFAVFFNFCGPAAQSDATIAGLPANIWYKFGLFHNATAMKIPSGMLVVTLVSNFGTFLLYMMTCIVAIVAFREHKMFNGIKHMVIPVFGLLANLGCMLFYLIGPFSVAGMSWHEPYVALGFAAIWGIYGAIYFISRSKKTGKPVILTQPAPVSANA
jgi:amino acid transporter